MAAASTFSYAQAAKGQGSPAAQTPSSNTQPENATSAPASDSQATSQTDPSNTPSQASKTESRPTVPVWNGAEVATAPEADAKLESTLLKRSESKRDDDAAGLDRPWRRNDKSTRSSSAATRSVDEHEARKSRKGKKGKSADSNGDNASSVADQDQKEEAEAPKIELSEAPIPTVNIWQQRKQARQTKAKPNPTATAADGAQPKPAHVNGTGKPHPKTGEKPERNGSRGSRLAGREAKEGKLEVPPPVDDAVSWPTPETTIQEDKKKMADKPERSDKDAGEETAQAKPRQKTEWVPYEYVPTASFETQLPQMRGSKPRGGARGANGTRSGAGAQGGDKATSKSGEPRDRTREPGAANRPTSMPPTANKRASVDVASTKGEQKKPAHNAEKAKDAAAPGQQDQQQPLGREGRGERGRGGYRGRGGHHASNSHAQHQHSTSMGALAVQPSASNQARAQGQGGPYSPPPKQGHGQNFMPPAQRGGRGGRNGGGNYHRMSLTNGTARPPPVQTQFAPYEYPAAPVSAMPLPQVPFYDPEHVGMVRSQLEYYLSFDNLCKDMFLRAHMDSQGFVPLLFITSFKRLRELTTDMNLIRVVCEESVNLDFVLDGDCERVRPRTGWQQFVQPMEERYEMGQYDGPVQPIWKSRSYAYPQYGGMAAPSFPVASPAMYPDQGYPGPFASENVNREGVNGVTSGRRGPTKLSADVPDFSPSGTTDWTTMVPKPAPEVNGYEAAEPVPEANSNEAAEPVPEANSNEAAAPAPEEDSHEPAPAAVNGLTNGDHSQGAGQS